MFYRYGMDVLVRIIAYSSDRRQVHFGNIDVHSVSMSQSCLCSFLCNPYITLQISIYLYNLLITQVACVELQIGLTSKFLIYCNHNRCV